MSATHELGSHRLPQSVRALCLDWSTDARSLWLLLCGTIQYDEMWADNPRFVKYDFRKPLEVR